MARRDKQSRGEDRRWRQHQDSRRRAKEARARLKEERHAPPDLDEIRGALGGIEGGATASQVAQALGSDDPRPIAQALRRMVEQGQVLESRPGRYLLSGTDGEHAATLTEDADGRLTAKCEDGTLHLLHPSYTIGAKAGDVVQVLIGEDGQGVVTRILRRAGREVVGTVNFRPAGPVLVCDNRREGTLPVRSAFAKFRDTYKAGDRVVGVVEVDEDGEAGVHLTRILGAESPEIADFRYVCLAHDLPGDVPAEVMAEAQAIPDAFPAKGREDLRDELVITIDPATAKDFDDAISLKKDARGRWVVGVHIADVSHFVRPGTALDAEAAARGTSIYLVNRVIPMLPERISNGLCSLVPHQDRYCLSAFLTLDKNGDLVGTRISETIIHSRHRFTYEEAMAVIDGSDRSGKWDAETIEMVKTASTLAQKLRANREKAGALNLFSVEHRFSLDVEGNPTSVARESTDESHQLIEEFMLLANRAVAAWIDQRGLPCVYRIHDEPDEERMALFATLLEAYGIDARGHDNRFGLQKILQRISQEPPSARLVLNFLCLRAFAKAIYQVENVGHYALAFSHYAHFTSPIRRYPDLLVHRLAKLALRLKDYRDVEARPLYLDGLARQSSWLEQRAAMAERDIQARKAARYLAGRIGESFPAVVTGAAPHGLYLQLIETGMDGLLPMRALADDFYEFDHERQALVGKHSGRVLGVGAECDVEVDAVDIERAEVTLGLPGGAATIRSAKTRSRPAPAPAPAPTPAAPVATKAADGTLAKVLLGRAGKAKPAAPAEPPAKPAAKGKAAAKPAAKPAPADPPTGTVKRGRISAWLDRKAAERKSESDRYAKLSELIRKR
ncbi:MAG: ribonuclease [Planctomycetota bacterium]|jgi:ribonuclease R